MASPKAKPRFPVPFHDISIGISYTYLTLSLRSKSHHSNQQSSGDATSINLYTRNRHNVLLHRLLVFAQLILHFLFLLMNVAYAMLNYDFYSFSMISILKSCINVISSIHEIHHSIQQFCQCSLLTLFALL